MSAASVASHNGYSSRSNGSPSLSSPSAGLRPLHSNSTLLASGPAEGGRELMAWIRRWGDEQIAIWLAENKCGGYEQVFRENDIRGDVLFDVDQSALKEMGVHSVGDRIKLTLAIKKLKQACATTPVRTPPASMPAHTAHSPLRLAQKSIPPPLHLDSASRLGQAYQPSPPSQPLGSAGSASSANTSLSSAGSSSTQVHGRKGSSPRHQPGPPPAPAPRGGLPPPPVAAEPSPTLRGREKPPPVQPIGPRDQPGQWQAGSYGLPRAPTDQRAQVGRYASPVPVQPPPSISVSRSSPAHRKVPSSSTPHSSTSPSPSRTSTASAGPSHSSAQSLSHHPYALSSSPSPTSDAFGPASYYSSSSSRHGTAPASVALSPLGSGISAPLLSPIVETLSGIPSPLPSDLQRPATSSGHSGYTVGKGSFSRPTTAGGTVAVNSQGLVQNAPPPLEDLMRRTVRFTGPDESGSKMVSVDGARDAAEVILRVIKRFKQPHSGAKRQTETERGELITEVDGWAIFAVSSDGQGARVLPDSELIAICTSTTRPERQKGLMLRKVHHPQAHPPNPPSRKLQQFFGEPAPPASPPVRQQVDPASDLSSDEEPAEPRASRPSYSSMHRASTVSVMSGLLDWNQPVAPALPAQSTVSDNRASMISGGGPRKLRNFFGQRPPSELISSHLADYFPSAEKKLLRRSMASRRSIALGRPTSQYSTDGQSWENAGPASRFSIASVSSVGSSGPFLAPRDAPPVPAKDHYAPAPLNHARLSVDVGRLAAPALGEPEASNVPGDRRSRLSIRSNSSSQRDSDTASMLTVDEITAEVEHRRLSVAIWSNDTSEEEEQASMSRPKSRRLSEALSEEDEEEEDAEDDDDEDEEDEEPEAAGAGPEKVTSSGDRSQIKWIKGAVIGTGSFGVVSLGMVATTGMLMAVKQVELPTGDSANEERKRSMLTALQREITLLKAMEHPNIVQYLDSSSDGSHLNIFLEYVPGGSIAALLQNYGAFEEALVSNFVRQILTGLNYLHGQDIIHRDIKGANILVDNKGGIKISDFGISKKVEDNLLTSTRMHRASLAGSVFWMAPEVVKQVPYTSKADIWSIGSVTLEMLTGSHPYPNLTQMQAIFRIGSPAPRPEVPSDISADAQDFLQQSFIIDHSQRPSASELLEHAFIKPASDSVAPTPTSSAFPRRL